ncbi:hypothetical protein PMAYCL1PPCAC_21975, partial [Pristionchus mayeri]
RSEGGITLTLGQYLKTHCDSLAAAQQQHFDVQVVGCDGEVDQSGLVVTHNESLVCLCDLEVFVVLVLLALVIEQGRVLVHLQPLHHQFEDGSGNVGQRNGHPSPVLIVQIHV